jgi:ABC-2 type transport system permease protein
MRFLLHKAFAFIRRDFSIESGYPVAFLMGLIESLMLLVIFRFIGDLITPKAGAALSRYGGGYFAFALIGVAFARYFDLTLRMFSDSIRTAQVTGCLEAMICSRTGCVSIVLMSSLYSLISGGVQLLMILVGGVTLFGVNLRQMSVAPTLLILVLSIAIFMGFGVLSASAIVWLKKGDPITWILGGFASILGGAYFPVGVMPAWMQKISFLIPVRYSLDALRMTMLRGASFSAIERPAVTLLAMAAVLLPTSVAVFAGAVRKGRKEGTLMQY